MTRDESQAAPGLGAADTARTDKHCDVVALYCFAPLDNLEAHQARLRAICAAHDICGILLLAPEGINGTISGAADGLHAVLDEITGWPGFEAPSAKWSCALAAPFNRMKVRLKREIVTMGEADIDPNTEGGTRVAPEDWNALIARPDVVLIDVRNDYEVEIGSFEGAVDPETESFRAFPEWAANASELADKPPVAMFCTGGIRCEKASALLKQRGFGEVYKLDGGILKYLEMVPAEESRWHGSCFVFDRRVSLGHGLATGPHRLCSICRRPFVDPDEPEARGGYSARDCPDCEANATERAKSRAAARRHQLALSRGS